VRALRVLVMRSKACLKVVVGAMVMHFALIVMGMTTSLQLGSRFVNVSSVGEDIESGRRMAIKVRTCSNWPEKRIFVI